MGRPAAVRTLTKVVFVGAALTAALVSDCPESCRCTERDGLTVQCVSRDLEVIPGDLPRNTVTLLLASNRISHVPRGSFRELPQLQELDLSRNAIETLDAGSFQGVSAELRSLDLSRNRLRSLPRNALSQLRARVRLSHNPWHCECSLQEALRELRLEPDTVGEVRCFTAVREEFRGRSIIQVLDSGIDFCSFRHKTMDVAMFVTMFAWFAMVIAYVVCYVRHNREEVHRHLEYLRSPPGSSHSSKDFESVNTGL